MKNPQPIAMPEMPPWISKPDEMHVGQPVFHFGKPDDIWIVEAFHGAPPTRVTCAQGKGKDTIRQQFPIGSMATQPTPVLVRLLEERQAAKVEAAAKKEQSAPAPKPAKEPKAKPVGDVVAQVMSAAGTLDACYEVYAKAGIGTLEDLKAKIGHLSNGLQRMGIGNRLRTAWKAGKWDAEKALREMTK